MPFFGGPGDRAALQLAVRLQHQSKMRLFVLHLAVVGQTLDQLDADLLDAFKVLVVPDQVVLRSIEIGHDAWNPVREILSDQQWVFDLVLLGHSVKPVNRTRVGSIGGSPASNEPNGIYAETNFGARKPSFKRSFSLRTSAVTVEEEILGDLGTALFLMPGGPSLLIVHQLLDTTIHDTTTSNGNHMHP